VQLVYHSGEFPSFWARNVCLLAESRKSLGEFDALIVGSSSGEQ
jgi:hypothetical protein